MKSYTITVNGNVYDVTVEEKGWCDTAAAPHLRQHLQGTGSTGSTGHRLQNPTRQICSGEGRDSRQVFKIEAGVGQTVKRGDAVVIIEAMKMEIPVVAPEDGTVASIDVAVGDAVEQGHVLATMN